MNNSPYARNMGRKVAQEITEAGEIPALLNAEGVRRVIDKHGYLATTGLVDEVTRILRADRMGNRAGVTPIDRLWVWLGQPASGQEEPLMVITGDTEAPAYRPLIAVTEKSALDLQDIAIAAAKHTDSTPVLREFECVAVTNVEIGGR